MKFSQCFGVQNIDYVIVWGYVFFLYGLLFFFVFQNELCCNVVWEFVLNIENNVCELDSEECFVFRLIWFFCLYIDMGFFFICLMFVYIDKKSFFYEIRFFIILLNY